MDIATGLGLLAGAVVLSTLILMGGDLRMCLDTHGNLDEAARKAPLSH